MLANTLVGQEVAIGDQFIHITLSFKQKPTFSQQTNSTAHTLSLIFDSTQTTLTKSTLSIGNQQALKQFGIDALTLTQLKESLALTVETNQAWIIRWYTWTNEQGKKSTEKLELMCFAQPYLNHLEDITSKSKETTAFWPLVVIDPGHGGSAPGATWFGSKEKDLNLNIALKLKNLLLKAGIQAILTREADTNVTLTDRPLVAINKNATLFVSIHHNASGAAKNDLPLFHGIETYFFNAQEMLTQASLKNFIFINTASQQTIADQINNLLKHRVMQSRAFAQQMQNTLVGSVRQNYPIVKDNGTKTAHFRVILIGCTHIPSILVEVGYISNEEEYKRLINSAYQDLVTNGIYEAIARFLSTQQNI